MLTRLLPLMIAFPLVAQQPVVLGRAVTPDATIRISVPAGSIRVTAWAHDSIAVRGRVDAGAGRALLEGSQEAVRLLLEPPARPRGGGLADLDISLPRQARLWVTTTSANVEIMAQGGRVTITSTGGRVRLLGSVQETTVETLDGNVELALTAETARVRTASGTIVARGLIQHLDASSVSGPVLIGMEGPIAAARLESVSAEIAFKGALLAEGRLLAETHAGDIDLRLPPSLAATWQLTSYAGLLDNQLVPAALIKEGSRRGEWRFITGSGQARVEVRTFKGTVRLTARPLER